MKPSGEPIDQLLLDYFVEGELAGGQEREVLLRLDAEPDGWRRLALTFVEAQRWTREFRTMAAESEGGTCEPAAWMGPAPQRSRRKPASMRRLPGAWLAVAASGLVAAFLVGLAIGGLGHGRPATVVDIADAGKGEIEEFSQATHSPGAGVAEKGTPELPPSARAPILLAFHDPGSDTLRYVTVPVLEASEVLPGLVENPPPAIPLALKRFLEQSGFEVEERAHVEPVQLADGQRVDVVFNEANVRYCRLVQ
jgi:hypothetical protein